MVQVMTAIRTSARATCRASRTLTSESTEKDPRARNVLGRTNFGSESRDRSRRQDDRSRAMVTRPSSIGTPSTSPIKVERMAIRVSLDTSETGGRSVAVAGTRGS